MKELKYSLLSDGSSDQALIPIINWSIRRYINILIQNEWVDFRYLPKAKTPKSLSEKIELSLKLYPCDILFIHRDAENDSIEQRTKEIDKAVYSISNSEELHNKVYIIPVRMQEAWLLIDENAIRKASGNSSGSINLQMPAFQKLETIPDPKALLYKLLIDASELSGRRLKKFKQSIRKRPRRVSDLINDFSPLLNLKAFQAFDSELKKFSEQWYRA